MVSRGDAKLVRKEGRATRVTRLGCSIDEWNNLGNRVCAKASIDRGLFDKIAVKVN